VNEREQLEQAIAALEAQRAILGDAVVNAAVGPMREKLATLQAQQTVPPAGQQRKQVTVLFADVSGFTAMSETMDPEEVSATMNALWSRLDGAIIAHGGMIDKHIGDAVMALFGTPTAHEDDPERAIRAALAMQAELRAFTGGDENGATAGSAPRLRMRIGINTGVALLGRVGTTGEYTAMGDAVNLASRLEHAAPVGGILISHDTYRHVRGIFDVLPLEPISVKGKVEPIQVYIVRAAKPRAFRIPTRGVEGVETRTIGREAELNQLREGFFAAKTGSTTHLISIVAEAGMGKSRLLYEFQNWIELQPERTLLFKGRATQEMAKLPYALIRNMFAYRFEIQENDPAAVAREKLEQGMIRFMGSDNMEKIHFIGHLIGFDFSDSPYLQGILADARQIRDRTFHYVAQFFVQACSQSPAVVLLEDIHWADNNSLDLIEHVLHVQPKLPLFVLGLTRPSLFERRPGWGVGRMTSLRLDLEPLSEQESRRLVAEILRKAPEVPAALEDLIVNRVAGNPFYIEELIKMLIDDGVIVAGEDIWEIKLERLAKVRVPATLTGVLQARLDALSPPEREVLQEAAVVGRVFWGHVIEHLYNPDTKYRVPPTIKTEWLMNLTGKELIFKHATSDFDQTHEYIFKQAMLHDVTYESVLKRLRRAYHAQVAEGLIELSGERVMEYAGRIGEHYERAEDWTQAAIWYGRAGKQAQDTYAPEEAISFYQKALTLWNDDPSSIHVAQRFEVYEGLGEMLIAQARYLEATETFLTMRAAAETTGNVRIQARAWYGLATVQSNQGDHRAALESATQAESAAQMAGARIELTMALYMKGRSLSILGNAEAAMALGEQMLALTTEINERRQMARSLNLLGTTNGMLGRYSQSDRYFAQALSVCQELGDRMQEMDLLSNLGVNAEARGDHHAAIKRFQEALRISREIGHRDGELVFLSNLGTSRVGLEEYQAAEADLREAIEMAEAAGLGGVSDTYSFLAEACLGQEKVEEALAAARRALALGQNEEDQFFTAVAWRVLGKVASRLPEPIKVKDEPADQSESYDAVACFTKSLAICLETGLEGERARTLQAWALHELKHGDRSRGVAMWREAQQLFTEIGAELEVARMVALLSSLPGFVGTK
jgi:class 3 adenylate cyclase/tetratricopeptide (TPR) repeat protein